jgi:large subunit ribosomal protein L10
MRDEFGQAKSIVMTSHAGISVNEVNKLRSEFRAQGVTYHVIKNTLAKLAVAGTDLEPLADSFTGPTAVAYSFEDAVSPAKVASDYADENDKFVLKGGFLDGKVLSIAEVDQLAKMPSKDELRAKLLRTFIAGPTNFVRLLNAVPTQFLQVLNARKSDIEDAA